MTPNLHISVTKQNARGKSDAKYQLGREVFKESLAIDPNLTIAKQRQKLSNWSEHAWQYMSEGLRLAGMPE